MSYQSKPVWSGWAGPRNPKLLFVAEAWGRDEAETGGQPLVGQSGQEFWRMLGEAWPPAASHQQALQMQRLYGLAWVRSRSQWLEEESIAFTNVFNLRPEANNLESLCGTKKEMPSGYAYPALTKAKYLLPQYLPELSRLFQEIEQSKPNLVVALGNAACWALLQNTGISSIRGAITTSPVMGWPIKVLPTYHPAGLLYEGQWSRRPIMVADLMKARREAEFPEVRRPNRQVLVNPTLEDIQTWTSYILAFHHVSENSALMACDIETGNGQIKCVGFACSRDNAMVIPFVDMSKEGGSYWASPDLELAAWHCVRDLLESGIGLVFQNGVYDLQYLLKMGFRPKNVCEDTMLLHHSLFPEMQKGLGFLGSIYTNEPAWKLMRRLRPDTVKRDE